MRIDPFGLWVLGNLNLSDDQFSQIGAFQESIRAKLPPLLEQVLKENEKTPNDCCENKKYKKMLSHIAMYLKGVMDGINGNDPLYLKNKELDDPTHFAETLEHQGVMYFQNRHGKTYYWDLPTGDKEATFFHELTHLAGTDDNTSSLLDEAEWYADLYMAGKT